MAMRPERTALDGPAWPVPAVTPGSQVGAPAVWPTVDLTEGPAQSVIVSERSAHTEPGHTEPGHTEPGPTPPPEETAAARPPTAHRSALASLQARSLGELVSGAVAAGFVFLLAASVVTAFGHVPGQGVRARLLVAFNYANFLTAVALLLGMVCLLLLGRSAPRGGLAQPATRGPLKRPVREILTAVLAAEAALVGLGALVSFIVYLTLAGSLPAAGVGHLLAELAMLPVVAVTLLWGWAGGTAKLRVLFGVGSAGPGQTSTGQTSTGQTGPSTVTGPVGPPPVVSSSRDSQP